MPEDKVRDGDGGGKWTPGEWEACERGDYGDYDGDCIVILGDDRRIAIVLGTDEEARLIAAAPAMAEALRAILFQVVQGPVLERDACVTQARAALALAEGGEG